MSRVAGLFRQELRVVNIGLEGFAETLEALRVPHVHLDWRPPAGGKTELGAALAVLDGHFDAVEEANQEAFGRICSAQPVWTEVTRADAVIPALREDVVLHAGPPLDWERACGPVRGAVIGALLFEGMARSAKEAERLVATGRVRLEPCHHHGAVGPMAGVVSRSMPVVVVENRTHGNRAFATLNEGLGKVLRFGAYSEEVLVRLRWMGDVLAPALRAAVRASGGIDLKQIMARALHMGDECHNRNVAATSLLVRELLPHLGRGGLGGAAVAEVGEFLRRNDHFFLNLSMAACKATMDAAHGIPHCTLVTAMARNGTDFGIRVSGTRDRWFTVPAPRVEGLYFVGFTAEDASPDLGDSSITETAGLGGFAMAAAPAIVQFVGGTPEDALGFTREMAEITFGRNQTLTIPALGFGGTPTGIDVRKVVETGIAPVINTGIAHKEPGVGQVGAGLTRAPVECHAQALLALVEEERAG
ncbi:MAG: DUF1116 domain-containing protein [Bacillota bacterium]